LRTRLEATRVGLQDILANSSPFFRGSTPILLANKMVYELDCGFQISARGVQDDRAKYYMPIRPILGISDFRD
jgi:hypothetical protein